MIAVVTPSPVIVMIAVVTPIAVIVMIARFPFTAFPFATFSLPAFAFPAFAFPPIPPAAASLHARFPAELAEAHRPPMTVVAPAVLPAGRLSVGVRSVGVRSAAALSVDVLSTHPRPRLHHLAEVGETRAKTRTARPSLTAAPLPIHLGLRLQHLEIL